MTLFHNGSYVVSCLWEDRDKKPFENNVYVYDFCVYLNKDRLTGTHIRSRSGMGITEK